MNHFGLYLFIFCGSALAKNPVFPGWYADPGCAVLDNKYWIFSGFAGSDTDQTYFDAFSSSDMINWKKHPRVLDAKDVEWADNAFWSPAAFQHNGKYYLAFSAQSSTSGKPRGIGIAIADKPEGPYIDELDHPLIEGNEHGANPAEPFIFIDKDSTIYMLYGGWGESRLVKLSTNVIKSIVPFDAGSNFKRVTPEGFHDSSSMFERNGVYYYVWHSDNKVQYATSKSVLGPFSNARTIMTAPAHGMFKIQSPSVLKALNQDKYFLVYHRRPQDYTKRVVCVEDMKVDGNGNILEMWPTDEGPSNDNLADDQRGSTLSNNPTFRGWYSDPGGAVLDKKYWIFPSVAGPAAEQTYFDAFSSSDMINWKKHPHVLDAKNVDWAVKWFLSPSAFQHNGRYYLAFSAQNSKNRQGIGIATADKPEGPYRDLLGRPLLKGRKNGGTYGDPDIFMDKDSQIYMLYGAVGGSSLVKLSGNLTAVVPFEDGSKRMQVTPEGFGESSALFERNGIYYYLWSRDAEIKYSTSTSVVGPYSKGRTIMTTYGNEAYTVSAPSFIKAINQDKYYLVYNRKPQDVGKRVICVEDMKFDGNGNILEMRSTDEGPSADRRGSAFLAGIDYTLVYVVAAMHFTAFLF